ncbi:hypothetical protein [Blastococcus mobilis]|uniref:Uncharacterized protein n=1 Tax=Blastococcus mobilis TaxID=1938746 RepID=A0A238Z4Z5_9ACTN|nr:hypothetical protein [Blastococcus mobilis]SNR78069.1 hypothetical protein SAMN06272737_12517 [Blastococcus mobilis]
MFENQTIDLLPARTTMKVWGGKKKNGGNNKAVAVATNISVIKIEDSEVRDVTVTQDARATATAG